MKAGTPHIVLTSKEALALGGHFYSSLHFKRTLFGMVFEHFCGDYVTNTEHTRSPLLLLKTLTSLLIELDLEDSKRSSKLIDFGFSC